MSKIEPYIPKLIEGLRTTSVLIVAVTLGATLVALVVGSAGTSQIRVVRIVTTCISEFFRGTSTIVQLFWAYFALPMIPGAPQFGAMTTAVVVLSLNAGCFGAEMVRSAIKSVPRGQWDAAEASGLSRNRALRKVIGPQVWPVLVPALGSMSVEIVKGTAAASFITVQDLFFWGDQVRSVTGTTTEMFVILLLTYLILSVIVAGVFRLIEYLLPANRSYRSVAPVIADVKAADAKAADAREVARA
ncbi:MAG: amino acid ABC transporter permease [Ilumatobacteraceae bacterium]